MQVIPLLLLTSYLVLAQRFFKGWHERFEQDTDMSPEDRQLSAWMLFIATALWPVTVPISYLELTKAKREHQVTVAIESVIYYNDQQNCSATSLTAQLSELKTSQLVTPQSVNAWASKYSTAELN